MIKVSKPTPAILPSHTSAQNPAADQSTGQHKVHGHKEQKSSSHSSPKSAHLKKVLHSLVKEAFSGSNGTSTHPSTSPSSAAPKKRILKPTHSPIQPVASQAASPAVSIDAAMKEKWPDFVSFIQQSGVDDLLKGSKLQMSKTDVGEPTLPLDGQQQPWNAIKALFSLDPTWDGSKIPLSWRFDSQGLRMISASQWDTLVPTSKEPAHPGRFYIDLMTTTEGMNHTWVRLVDEKGNVHSIGMSGEIHKLGMYRGQVAKINCPDHREFTSEPHRQTRIAITKEQYEKAIAKVMTDQQDHNLYFNLLSRNCSVYASEILEETGLHLDNLEFASQLLNRSLINRVSLYMPKIVLKVAYVVSYLVRAIFGTLVNIMMGAWYQDREVAKLEAEHGHKWKTPLNKPFRSWKSFIDGTNYQMRSTFKIVEWQKYAIRFRKERVEALDKLKEGSRERLSLLPKARFEKLWDDFRLDFEYEKPPALDQDILFISDSEVVSKADLPKALAAWEKKIVTEYDLGAI